MFRDTSMCWTFYVLSLYILNTNTRTSAPHWKLIVEESGKNVIMKMPLSPPIPTSTTQTPSISLRPTGNFNKNNEQGSSLENTGGNPFGSQGQGRRLWVPGSTNYNGSLSRMTGASGNWLFNEDEIVLEILMSTVWTPRGSWTKSAHDSVLSTSCSRLPCPRNELGDGSIGTGGGLTSSTGDTGQEILDCGRPANFTYYDQLIGVANRQNHPHIPEPEVSLLFRKKSSKKDNIDLNTLERKLRKAKKEKPSSVQLYNQIGNFWRIKGHTLRAIECFRRALAVAPNNPEVLHNMARLLLTLQYLDDALFLARRSLELQAPDRSAWQQHFTLGEILKAYGHHQEALLHFKHTLELRPDHGGAQEALRELETLLSGTGLHICTLLIIIFLVLGVLLVMLSSLENDEPSDLSSRPPPRHFSRALAMRSLKLGISPRALRAKRLP